jgi:hypothetical protein
MPNDDISDVDIFVVTDASLVVQWLKIQGIFVFTLNITDSFTVEYSAAAKWFFLLLGVH